MSTTVLLIRHGAHDLLGRVLCGRMDGVGLNGAGHAQAAGLADRLAGAGIAAICTSPLERARQTAAPLAAACGLAVDEVRALQEIDFGSWTGSGFDALEADPIWQIWNRQRSFAHPPGGESALAAQLRIVHFLCDVRERFPAGVVAVVSHADMIKSAIAWAIGMSLDLHDRLEIAPASVSRLELAAWGSKLTGLNQAMAA